jgi:hypothetical protein
MRRLAFLAVFALAGCSGQAVTPAATPTYTKAQADACASDAIGWWSDAPAAYDVWTGGAGGSDLATGRKQAAAAAKKDAAVVATWTGTGADTEVAALHAALVAEAAAFAKTMTLDQFKAAYDAINNAELAYSDRCNTIEQWVQANVPQ